MSSQRKNFYAYLFIFLLALFLRSLYLMEIKDVGVFSLLLGDAKSYATWAQDISKGNWLGSRVFYQAPLYPYFLAVYYSVFGLNPFGIRLIQILLGAAACLLIARAGRHFFSNQAGLLSGLLLAIYPTAIFFDGLIQKAVLNLFFMTLLLFLLGKNHSQPSGKLWFACGLVLACLGLTRENALILVLPISLWLLHHFCAEAGERKKWMAWTCLFLLGLSIGLFPVALRNKMVGGDFALTTAQFGPNFYIGNHHNASGMYEPLRGGRGSWRYEQQDALALAEQAVGRHLSPSEVSRFWTHKTLDEILSNPGDWILLMAKKWLLFWNFIENSDTESQYAYENWSVILNVLGRFLHFGVVASLAIFGICMTAKDFRKLWLLHLLVIFYAASVTLFFIFARYRLPVVPLVVLFAAAGVVQGYQHFSQKKITALALSTAIALLGATAINWKIIPQDQNHFRALSLGNMCTESLVVGRTQQAVEYCRQSLKYGPRKVKVLTNLGAALIEERRFEEALPVLQRAVTINPNIAKAHANLEVAKSYLAASQSVSQDLHDIRRLKRDAEP